jgi:Polyketide cyclase / dehydrase and lipid transport
MRARGLSPMMLAMASIYKDVRIDVNPDQAWDALRDFGALHERLARGFVTDTRLEGTDRIVTFVNGSVVRERLVSIDDEARRLVWSIVDGPYAHHNGSAQVFCDCDRRTWFVWTADVLPDEIAGRTAEMMERGLAAIKGTLESAARSAQAA